MFQMIFLMVIVLSMKDTGAFLVPNGKTTAQTPVGEIVGFISTVTLRGRQRAVRNFLGIPYAEPPMNSLRFRKPVPKARFSSPFDASKFGHSCFQFEGKIKANENISFSEDCLTLNIFAPEELPDNNKLYPVMIYIHGGGFSYGMSSDYDSGHLCLEGNVIVVTLNYRLNVFGFLSTSYNESAGNFGLFDQQLAIKWVHDNIHAFGGDTNRITIFGESAGAAAVIYQALYPGNRGLFQRVIAQSGSAISPWAFTTQQMAYNRSLQYAIAAGCSQRDSATVISCLQTKSTQEIRDVLNVDAETFKKWTPVADGDFITADPVYTLTEQHMAQDISDMFNGVDLIIGVNSKEGLNTYHYEFSDANFTKADIDNSFIPRILIESMSGNISDLVTQAAVFDYTDWYHLDNKYKQFDSFIDLISDLNFNVPTFRTALEHSAGSNKTTFVYKLSVAPPYRYVAIDSHVDGPTVADHADDLTFLFAPWVAEPEYMTPGSLNINISNQQRNTAKAMITMWTNFAHSGDPNKPVDVQQYINSTWTQYDPASQIYLEISPAMDSHSVKRGFAATAVAFWTKLIPALRQSD